LLTELYIRNFAIIDELRVKFGAGLNVLTGETGAGKSIIVDALGAALGQRVGAESIRTGADQALAEAVFELTAPRDGESVGGESALQALLADSGLEVEDGLVILGREINRGSGRTTARINGRAVPLSVLQQAGQLLVDIHGQSEHLSLLRVREHVDYLDRYAGLMGLREEVARAVRELQAVRGEIEQMARDEREAAREIDLLKYQIQEIRGAGLCDGEEDGLMAERIRLRNAGRLRELATALHRLVSGGDDQVGIVDLLAQADRLYLELVRLDPSQEVDRQALETMRYSIEDLGRRMTDYVDAVEDAPDRLIEVEERLELLSRLKRKYGRTLTEVLQYLEESESRLQRLSNRAYYLDELRQAESSLLDRVGGLASRLSRERREAARGLAEEVQRELGALNMKGTRFQVAFSVARDAKGVPWAGSEGAGDQPDRVAFDSTGVDKVEFLVSPNPGEEPKSLARIASGGETARLMLALKTILSKADAIPTLVFDEIDVGVGARSGTRVGEKLWQLAASHQVLCVTHMPQIACMADRHLSVEKLVEGGRTRTSVQLLEGDRQEAELAAMLAGTTEFESALASARDLLRRAAETKKGRST